MPRSHPPTLLTTTQRTIREEGLVVPGSVVLVAVSGGPDSMALLHVLARLRAKLRFSLVAHGVDHGLRAPAVAELDVAASFARTLDVPFSRTTLALRDGGNLQARARAARYDALRIAAVSAGATRIATAHHADDRAETVLLRLLRGAGPRGLAALPPRAGDLIRPFIAARRATIEAHAARHLVPSSQDPSNRDPRYGRTRVRHELLPRMAELSPSIVLHLCALADQLREGPSAVGLPDEGALPRAARVALATLERNRSKTTRVSLPGGVVARYDRTQGKLVVVVGSPREASTKATRGSGRAERERG